MGIEILYILLGIVAGGLSGLIGIGGGIIIVPALIFLFGMSQHLAQGTALSLFIAPVGLIAAFQYYKSGNVDIRIAILLVIGFLIGSIFGSKLAFIMPEKIVSKVFAVTILLISLKMLFGK